MGIFLNVSNALHPLSDRLSVKLKNNHDDPFAAQWIITQTEGMNSWLKQVLAKNLGIASNIRFAKPNDIITKIYQWSVPGGKPFMDTETVSWSLYAILDDADFKNEFKDIAVYYNNNSIKQIALASELADLFDQYQIYRSEKIREWNADWKQDIKPIDWQQALWIRTKKILHEYYHDRVEMSDAILAKLKETEFQILIQKRLPRLQFFGVAVITPYFLQVFHALSSFIDIHLYLINPAPDHYWLDDKSEKQISRLFQGRPAFNQNDHVLAGNDLLLNWGKIIKESTGLLFQNDDFINSYDTVSTLQPDKAQNLLQKIQLDIFNNATAENRQSIAPEDIKDGSFTINGCFTPIREVEVLYNYLVKLVDDSSNAISAREILVLVSDIDQYAPFIHAVFKNAPYRFPYTIADETITADNNLFSAIQQILMLDDVYFKAESVLELLESPFIRQRFQITDVEALRTAVRQAGIIFSMNGRIEDDTRLISWNYGIKRMLFGICMSGEPEYSDGRESFIPLDTDEGVSALERVRLIHFVQVLQDKLKLRKTDRIISGWAAYLQELVDDLVFQAGERDDENYAHFISLIEQMTALDDVNAIPVNYEVFRHSFLQRLSLEKKSHAFAGAGITFCSLVPMRSIPFRVVAMLGMNFDQFPRKETLLSFSLLAKNPMPGDRNVKDNDKHLFLETLLSAKEYLYISYIARSEKDGAVLPPSAIIDECIDYVATGMKIDTDDLRKEWVTIHPLHGFSREYFKPDGLINYLSEDRYRTAIEVKEMIKDPVVFQFEKIQLNKLADFLKNPAKFHLEKQFSLNYFEDNDQLPEYEMFEFDTLDKWNAQYQLLTAKDEDLENVLNDLKKSGATPLHNMGVALVRSVLDDIQPLREQFLEATKNESPRSIDISIRLGETELLGKVEGIYGDRFISICNSKDRPKYLVRDYVKYLALLAQGEELAFVFVAKGILIPPSIPVNTISREKALTILGQYISWFKEGHTRYFHFFPAIAKENFKMINGGFTEFEDQLKKKRENERDFDFRDDHLDIAIDDGFISEENYPALQQNVHDILDPLFKLMPEIFSK